MYADTLLSRQLQDGESDSLEQRGDALIKKPELINHIKKSTFNSHCGQIPHKHEQSVQIGPSSYNSDKTRRQKHRHTPSHEYHNVEQIPLYHGGNSDPPSSHNDSSIIGDSEVSRVYICFACGMDGHISRFCSQMQSLVDHGPNNNILYSHGPPLLVNRDIHEQNAQELTHGHHVDKKDKSYTRPNRTGNRNRD